MKKSESKEIIYNIVNSVLTGLISFISATIATISTNGFNFDKILVPIILGILTSALVATYKFKDYWDGEKTEFQYHVFNLI